MMVELLLDNNAVIRDLAKEMICDHDAAERAAAHIHSECKRLRAEGVTWVSVGRCEYGPRVRVEASQPV